MTRIMHSAFVSRFTSETNMLRLIAMSKTNQEASVRFFFPVVFFLDLTTLMGSGVGESTGSSGTSYGTKDVRREGAGGCEGVLDLDVDGASGVELFDLRTAPCGISPSFSITKEAEDANACDLSTGNLESLISVGTRYISERYPHRGQCFDYLACLQVALWVLNRHPLFEQQVGCRR